MTQDIILYRDFPYVDIKMKINWREQHKMLKMEFPVSFSGEITAEIPYGHINRKADGREYPIQRWLDVSGGDIGLSVVNDVCCAADVMENNIRMTILRSPIYADHYGVEFRDGLCEFTEQGEHEARFRLLPHDGNWRTAGVVQAASELNAPPVLVYASYQKGPLPLINKGIDIDAPNVFATVLKENEDGGAFVLRCCEAHGKAVTVNISLPYINRRFSAEFKAHEIKTFVVPKDKSLPVTETDFLEGS